MLDETKEESPLTYDLEMFGTYSDIDGSIYYTSPEPECPVRGAGVGNYWPGIDQMILLGLILANTPDDDIQSHPSRLKEAMKTVLREKKNPPNWWDDFDMHALRWMAEEQFWEEKAVFEHRQLSQPGEEPARRSQRELAEQAFARFKCSIPATLQQKYSLSYGGESRGDNPEHKGALAYQALHAKGELAEKQAFLENLREVLAEFRVGFENPLDNSRITK